MPTAMPHASTANRPAAHRLRRFDALPDAAAARGLLHEIASGDCPFGPVEADRPLALYGAGNLGRLARSYLAAVGQDVAMAIDRNAEKLTDDAAWSGVPVLHPDAVPAARKREMRVAVAVVTAPYVPLESALRAAGFPDVIPFYDLTPSFQHLHPLANGWFAPRLSSADVAAIEDVLAGWDDDVSRAHHLQFIAWRRLREEWDFANAPATVADRYFIPEVDVVLHGHECLFDGGAHHGEVVQTLLQRTGGAAAIVAVEPDAASRAVLRDVLRAGGVHAEVLDCALAASDGTARFHDGLDYASQLSSRGTCEIATCRIDSLGVRPSFLKLHLEGAELHALMGARDTLLAARPLLAATVYHNADGIFATAEWLMRNLPDYRLLFRLHGWCGNGAVVYGIPYERRSRAFLKPSSRSRAP